MNSTTLRKILAEITRFANRNGLSSIIKWRKAGIDGTVYICLPEAELAFDFDFAAECFIRMRGLDKLPRLSLNSGDQAKLKGFLCGIKTVIQALKPKPGPAISLTRDSDVRLGERAGLS